MSAAAPHAAPGWEARGLTYRHPGAPRPAVDGVTLDVPAGRLTAVLGPNGAGKSTLLALLLGTLRPAAGSAAFAGTPLGAWPRAALARRVGVVPQGEAFAFPLAVRDLVEMGRYPHLGAWEPARAADRRVVDAAIARAGLEGMAERDVATLSGGERQRARLARALAQIAGGQVAGGAGDDPAAPGPGSALALDEPTAALDLAHEMSFFELARALADAGTTVLLVTHHLNLAARYADRLVLMHEGRVEAAGSGAEVLTAERVSRVYGWPVEVVPFPHAFPRGGGAAPQVVPLAGAGG